MSVMAKGHSTYISLWDDQESSLGGADLDNSDAVPSVAVLQERVDSLDSQIEALVDERDSHRRAIAILRQGHVQPMRSANGLPTKEEMPDLPDLNGLGISLDGATNHAERVMRIVRKAGTFSVWQVAEFLVSATGSKSPIKNIKSPVYETIRKHPQLFERTGPGEGIYRYVGDDTDAPASAP